MYAIVEYIEDRRRRRADPMKKEWFRRNELAVSKRKYEIAGIEHLPDHNTFAPLGDLKDRRRAKQGEQDCDCPDREREGHQEPFLDGPVHLR